MPDGWYSLRLGLTRAECGVIGVSLKADSKRMKIFFLLLTLQISRHTTYPPAPIAIAPIGFYGT